jgi:hypothetical protein
LCGCNKAGRTRVSAADWGNFARFCGLGRADLFLAGTSARAMIEVGIGASAELVRQAGQEPVRRGWRRIEESGVWTRSLVVAMAPEGVTVARLVGLARYVPRIAVLLAVAAISVCAAACSSSGATVSQHGVVIGHLLIPFMPKATTGRADIFAVTVRAGQRFSVEVDTSAGPNGGPRPVRRQIPHIPGQPVCHRSPSAG